MSNLSYRSPKTVVKESQIHGRGLFAREPIAQGEIVAIKGDTSLTQPPCVMSNRPSGRRRSPLRRAFSSDP
jgi:SET domain-containing protein